jgi:ADP-heptose:LPS heptosyltransferase
MQSNRGTALLGLSGARLRVARRNDSHKRWWWQPLLLSRTLRAPYHEYPMFQQRWDCLHDAGLAGVRPTRLTDAGAVIDPALRRARGIAPEDDGHYLHLSASATDDLRDLPPAQMRELWEALHTQFPRHRLAVSASNTVRGRGKLKALLDALSFTPWKVFAGDLDVPAFASVIQGAALHVGPDSGGLHIARIAGTPSVSWFRPNEHLGNWLPTEPGHRAVVAPESTAEGLQGIAAEALVGLARELLDGH